MKDLLIKIVHNPEKSDLIALFKSMTLKKNQNPEAIVKNLLSFAKYHILAYNDGKLCGLLSLVEANPSMVVIYDDHPIVSIGYGEFSLKQKMVRKAMNYLENIGISNLRAFIFQNEDNDESFREQNNLYLATEMINTNIHYCLRNKISKDNLRPDKIPDLFRFSPFIAEKREVIQKCYDRVFKDSLDDFINSFGEEESKYWDYLGSNHIPESSVVLKDGKKVIGFIGTRDEGEYIEIGPVGILPEFRNQGLGKALLNYALQNLITLGRTKCYLEVGSRNRVALKLYQSFGFAIYGKKYGYLKRLSP